MNFADKPYVLFDFDGTLSDTKPCIVATAEKALRSMGYSDEFIGDAGRLIGPPFPYAFKLVYGLSDEDAEEATRRYREVYGALGPERNPLFEGVYEMLEELRANGRKLAIVSSKLEKFVKLALDQTNTEHLFDVVVTQTGKNNASKAGLVGRALKFFGADPSQAVMIGDRSYDIEGAKANGVDSIGVYFGDTAPAGELESAGASLIVSTVSDLKDALLG